MRFNPVGTLNVAVDASDLKEGDFVRCKNLRIDQQGQAKTRDGSAKLNESAINVDMWLLEEMEGVRYAFSGTSIYEDESSLASGLTSAQWSALQYNAFNDSTKQIFALNGTDRKRIVSGSVNEWGIDPPVTAPTLTSGGGTGLTGQYNVKYTYVRKVSGAIVSESNPSDAATNSVVLNDQSLAISFTQPSDTQVTHIRAYRTLAGGSTYFLDSEVAANTTITFGYAEQFEADDGYIAGTGFKFTIEDTTNGTENCYTWEELFADREDQGTGGSESGGQPDLPFTPADQPPREGGDLP